MKAQIPDQQFRKADYNIFPTLVQVHHIDCDTKIVNRYNTSTSCWKEYSTEKQKLKNRYKIEKRSSIVSYGGCF